MVYCKIFRQEDEINLNTKNPEFKNGRIPHQKLPEVIVDFKKNLYISLVKEISVIIN